MNANVCLLVIGDLGETGKLSLATLENINPSKICVAANLSGKSWLDKNITFSIREKICLHDSLLEDFEYKQFNLKSEYSEYRSNDFRLLTLLKWDLLTDSIRKHSDSGVTLFSDLDIYWFNDPTETLVKLMKSTSELFVQDDASERRPNWCCTGVMFWKNSDESISSISALRELQKKMIDAGNPQDDEDTFNQMIKQDSKSIAYSRLPQNEYIVGRNFVKMLFLRIYKVNKVCFHANYLTGLNRKQKLLNSVDKYVNAGVLPIKEVFRFVLEPKIRRLKEGIKRRLP